jgi:WD40 repeat protein
LASILGKNQQNFLASGSDHGCCCLILWDTRTWTIASRIQAHAAAVTAIVDLEDGEHLVSGSYDKKINIFNHLRGQVISSFNTKSGVTSIVLTSDRKKLVSAGLDNSLQVWTIVQKSNVNIALFRD